MLNPYALPGIKFHPNQVIRIWEEYFDTTIEEIQVKNRHKETVIKRHILAYMLRKFANISQKATGDFIHRDHASVLWSCRVVQNTYLQDKELRQVIEPLLNQYEELAGKYQQSINVKITRADLFRLMPDLTDEQREWNLRALWVHYKENYQKT